MNRWLVFLKDYYWFIVNVISKSDCSRPSVSTGNWFRDLLLIPKSAGAQAPLLALCIFGFHISRFNQPWIIYVNSAFIEKKICIQVDLQQLKFMLFRISCLFSWLIGPTDWIDNLLISSNHWRPSLMICLWKMAHFQRGFMDAYGTTKVSWVVCCGGEGSLDGWTLSTLSSLRSAPLLLVCVLGIRFILFDRELPLPKKKLESPWINWWWMCAWLSICVLTVPINGLVSPESPGTLLLSFLRDLLITSKTRLMVFKWLHVEGLLKIGWKNQESKLSTITRRNPVGINVKFYT